MSKSTSLEKPFTFAPSEDYSELRLVVEPHAGEKEVLVGDILVAAAQMGLKVRVEETAVKEACAESAAGRQGTAVIARGTPCRHGSDGKLQWSTKIVGEQGKGERRSHYSEGVQKNVVKKDDPVARLVGETEGTEGSDVYGNPIKPERGQPLKIRVGPGLREADGIVLAEKDGLVRLDKDTMRLDEVLVVNGDLDFETGNINFPGSVVITGGILDLFEVRANGSIRVGGTVEGAHLCAKGDVEVKGGVAGKRKGRVTAGGCILAKFLGNADVCAEKDVCVESEIVASRVTAFGAVKVPTGRIAGGDIEALGGIDAETVGSDIGAKTVITAGVSRTLVHIAQKLQERIESAQGRLAQIKHQLAKPPAGFAPGKHKRLEGEREKLEKEILAALQDSKRLRGASQAAKAVIVVRKVIYPGVVVRLGQYNLTIEKEKTGPLKLVPDEKNATVRFLGAG